MYTFDCTFIHNNLKIFCTVGGEPVLTEVSIAEKRATWKIKSGVWLIMLLTVRHAKSKKALSLSSKGRCGWCLRQSGCSQGLVPTHRLAWAVAKAEKKKKAFSSPRKSASSLSLTYLPNVCQGMLWGSGLFIYSVILCVVDYNSH